MGQKVGWGLGALVAASMLQVMPAVAKPGVVVPELLGGSPEMNPGLEVLWETGEKDCPVGTQQQSPNDLWQGDAGNNPLWGDCPENVSAPVAPKTEPTKTCTLAEIQDILKKQNNILNVEAAVYKGRGCR